MINSRTILTMVVAAGAMAFSAAQAGPLKSHTHKVKCDKGASLQKAVGKAHNDDTLVVSGTCTQNVTIRVDQIRLIGTGGAAIDPADTSVATVSVLATNVRIRGFSITVGTDRQGIIVNRGGSAVIEDNTITGNGKASGTTGILVTSNSYARICSSNTSLGNTITDHRRGVTVRLGGGADIFKNTMDGNDRGINLTHLGAADISGNTLSNNTRGLNVFANAAASLSSVPSSPGDENIFNNNTIGIRCSLGGSVTEIPQTFGAGPLANGTDQGKFGSCSTSNSLGPFTPL